MTLLICTTTRPDTLLAALVRMTVLVVALCRLKPVTLEPVSLPKVAVLASIPVGVLQVLISATSQYWSSTEPSVCEVGRVNVNLWFTTPPGVEPPVKPSVLVSNVSERLVICAAFAVVALTRLATVAPSNNPIRRIPLTLTLLICY